MWCYSLLESDSKMLFASKKLFSKLIYLVGYIPCMADVFVSSCHAVLCSRNCLSSFFILASPFVLKVHCVKDMLFRYTLHHSLLFSYIWNVLCESYHVWYWRRVPWFLLMRCMLILLFELTSVSCNSALNCSPGTHLTLP